MNTACSRVVLASLLLLVCAAGTASATLHMEQISMVPDSRQIMPESPVKLAFGITVVPSGGRTFADGHSLQLTTDLRNASWELAVFVDGIQAATIPAGGRAAFVNGYLLSYETLRDVSINVTVTGTTPPGMDTSGINLVQVTELDNAGKPVPGSGFAMPLLYPTTRITPAPTTNRTDGIAPGSQATPGAPGFSFQGAALATIAGAFAICTGYRRRR
ncbi:MAG: hypothetical protein LUQ25_00805 [Methanoregulaceae archaeon]|nr:hypothetical protein [Methanoregulaceae archaeon]